MRVVTNKRQAFDGLRQKGATTMLTRVMKATLAVLVAGLIGTSNSTAEAFWGHRQVVTTTGYAPVVAAAPVVTGYAPAYATTSYSLPSVPVVAASPVIVSRPIVAAAPVVAAPVTSYYAP